jgi:hypothetical protein
MLKMLDFFYLINKRWATSKDVKKYLNCSEEEAFSIIQVLQYEAKKKNLYMPKTKYIYVPMEIFVDYFHIDRKLQERYHNSLCECRYI